MWVFRLGVLSLGVWGVVFLLVQVRYLGKYYSCVGRHISPSLSIGAQARLMQIYSIKILIYVQVKDFLILILIPVVKQPTMQPTGSRPVSK